MNIKYHTPPGKSLANIAIQDHLKTVLYKWFPYNTTTTKAITINPKDATFNQDTIKDLDKYLNRHFKGGFFYLIETPRGMYKQDQFLNDYRNERFNTLHEDFNYHVHLIVNSDFNEETLLKKFNRKLKSMDIHVQPYKSKGLAGYNLKQLDNMNRVSDRHKLDKEGIVFNYKIPLN